MASTLYPRFSGQHQVCCIPTSDDKAKILQDVDSDVIGNDQQDCCFLPSDSQPNHHVNSNGNRPITVSSIMFTKQGPYGQHAMASQDIKAGSVIVQCLPLAHSLFFSPGTALTIHEQESSEECNERRRCARCFHQEGGIDGGRSQRFGRCSRCRVPYYCSRSCQV